MNDLLDGLRVLCDELIVKANNEEGSENRMLLKAEALGVQTAMIYILRNLELLEDK